MLKSSLQKKDTPYTPSVRIWDSVVSAFDFDSTITGTAAALPARMALAETRLRCKRFQGCQGCCQASCNSFHVTTCLRPVSRQKCRRSCLC